ncbi:YbaB/EbfC family nucleoid-associated protein [Haloglycomyces albus]|uniref:YbaB/EbfC family nucleoid-associated protein n=1 Tax=Haloglycomyces albus TaxID=526067 RepID=UPI003CCBEA6F
MQSAAARIEGESVSEDHAVTVRVGVSGTINDLELNHRAFEMKGDELGERIVATYKAARVEAKQQLSEVQAQVMGGPAPDYGASAEEVGLDDIRRRLRKDTELCRNEVPSPLISTAPCSTWRRSVKTPSRH